MLERLASEALFIPVQLGLCIAIGLAVGDSLWRRSAAALLLVAAFALPFLLGLSPIGRVVLTLLALVALIKSVMIAASTPQWTTPGLRVWQVLFPFDIRLTRRTPPGLEVQSLIRIMVALTMTALSLWVGLRYGSRLQGWGADVFKAGCAVVFAYSLMEMAGEAIRSAHRLFGVAVDPLQRDPILSCSLAEFWGERWNVPITRWLNEYFFRPLARKGHPTAGVILAFTVSAALHWWLFYAGAGWWGALVASSFFLAQIPAMLLERPMRVRRWPTAARRIWAIGFLLITSPLFVLPMIRGLEMQMSAR